MKFKKLFSFLLIFSLGFGFFYVPAVLAVAVTGQACVDAAQNERAECYAQDGADGAVLEQCDEVFSSAVSKCKGLYSTNSIGGLINPLSGKDVPTLVGNIIRAVLGIVGSIALILFIYSGVMWMTARGNPEQVKGATKTMMWTFLGLLMIFSSYLILDLVFKALTKK